MCMLLYKCDKIIIAVIKCFYSYVMTVPGGKCVVFAAILT